MKVKRKTKCNYRGGNNEIGSPINHGFSVSNSFVSKRAVSPKLKAIKEMTETPKHMQPKKIKKRRKICCKKKVEISSWITSKSSISSNVSAQSRQLLTRSCLGPKAMRNKGKFDKVAVNLQIDHFRKLHSKSDNVFSPALNMGFVPLSPRTILSYHCHLKDNPLQTPVSYNDNTGENDGICKSNNVIAADASKEAAKGLSDVEIVSSVVKKNQVDQSVSEKNDLRMQISANNKPVVMAQNEKNSKEESTQPKRKLKTFATPSVSSPELIVLDDSIASCSSSPHKSEEVSHESDSRGTKTSGPCEPEIEIVAEIDGINKNPQAVIKRWGPKIGSQHTYFQTTLNHWTTSGAPIPSFPTMGVRQVQKTLKPSASLSTFNHSRKAATCGKTLKPFTSQPSVMSSRNFSNIIHEGGRTQQKKGSLRPVVIDGQNVAFGHSIALGEGEEFSSRGIELCVQFFKGRGHKDIHVFLPRFRLKSGLVGGRNILEDLQRQGILTLTPSRTIDGCHINSYDDRYIVQYATLVGGVIVSNDNYQDLMLEDDNLREAIKNRLLKFTWVKDTLMFPQDPLGKHGPDLNTFLRF